MQGRFYTLKSLGIALERAKNARFAEIRGPGQTWFNRGRHRMQDGSLLRDAARRLAGLALASIALLMAGCAGMAPGIDKDTPPEQKQKIVAERAEARWQALIKGDLDTAYTYLSPGSRATTPLAVYKSKTKPGLWRQAKVQEVSCDGDVCKVMMQIAYDYKKIKGIETPLTENWIIENGTAWYVYR